MSLVLRLREKFYDNESLASAGIGERTFKRLIDVNAEQSHLHIICSRPKCKLWLLTIRKIGIIVVEHVAHILCHDLEGDVYVVLIANIEVSS
jgi:hypothetical protein